MSGYSRGARRPAAEPRPGRVAVGDDRAARVSDPRPGRTSRAAADDPAVRRSQAQWAASLIYFAFGVIEIVLAIRVFLKLIAANTATGFTRLIYSLSGPFVAPFKNIVTTPVAANGATFEASSLIAIAIYLLLSWLLVRLLFLLIARPTGDDYATPAPRETGLEG